MNDSIPTPYFEIMVHFEDINVSVYQIWANGHILYPKIGPIFSSYRRSNIQEEFYKGKDGYSQTYFHIFGH